MGLFVKRNTVAGGCALHYAKTVQTTDRIAFMGVVFEIKSINQMSLHITFYGWYKNRSAVFLCLLFDQQDK